MRDEIQVNIWKKLIMELVMTKFGCLKTENSGDVMMISDAIHHNMQHTVNERCYDVTYLNLKTRNSDVIHHICKAMPR